MCRLFAHTVMILSIMCASEKESYTTDSVIQKTFSNANFYSGRAAVKHSRVVMCYRFRASNNKIQIKSKNGTSALRVQQAGNFPLLDEEV